MEVESEDVTIGEVARKRGRGRPRKYKPREELSDDELEQEEQRRSNKENPAGSHSNSPSWRDYWNSFYNERDEEAERRSKEFHSKGNARKNEINPWIYKGIAVGALTGFYYYLQRSGVGGSVSESTNAKPVAESLTEAVKEAVTAPVEAVKETVAPVQSETGEPGVSAWGRQSKKSNKW